MLWEMNVAVSFRRKRKNIVMHQNFHIETKQIAGNDENIRMGKNTRSKQKNTRSEKNNVWNYLVVWLVGLAL